MRKTINLLILIFSFFFIFGCEEKGIPEDVNTVNIFTMNDTHGAFVTDGFSGMEKVASVINNMEKDFGKFLKITTGDIFQGTYVSNINYGIPLLEALNLLKFDAFVIGNHEFDWGIEKISQYKDNDSRNGEADFPFLAANIVYKESKERLPWTEDYVILENNGYKVGIIGVIGHNLESSISSDKVADYEFLNPRSIVQELSFSLRSEFECDIVVVATHSYDDWEINDYLQLPNESRIDGIITGHNHQKLSTKHLRSDGYYVPVIQCDDKNENVGGIIIEMDDEKSPVKATIRHYNPSEYRNDRGMLDLIDKYSSDINEGNRNIGYTTETLYQGKIGTEITKAMVEKFGGTAAFINTGGVRTTLQRGNIRIKDIFEVFPFDNRIVLTSLKGSVLKDLYHKQGQSLYFDPYFQVSKINDDLTYDVITIDYIFTGSNFLKYFKTSPREDDVLMRDLFIDYIEDFYKK